MNKQKELLNLLNEEKNIDEIQEYIKKVINHESY